MTDEEYKKYYKDDTIKSLMPEYRQASEKLYKKMNARKWSFLGAFFVWYSIVLYALFNPIDSKGVGMMLLFAAICSHIHFFTNGLIFSWLIRKNREDKVPVEHLEKRLRFAKEREDPINAFFERGM
jgi:hypothetical protein